MQGQTPKKVFIKTFGCQMNEYDSDKMADVLQAARGYEPTDDVEQAIANAVPKIQVKNTTIRQTLEKEVHERPVYRDCVGDPRARQLLNDTIGAVTAGASAPGAVELPASGPAR